VATDFAIRSNCGDLPSRANNCRRRVEIGQHLRCANQVEAVDRE
jgi:hypothetical protein